MTDTEALHLAVFIRAKSARLANLRCNRCHRPMAGTTAYDGACACGGLIEASSERKNARPREEGKGLGGSFGARP